MMDEPINWDEIKLTWPYIDKICERCVWALPTTNLSSEDVDCRYFNKTINPQLPACNYFVHWIVRHLL